MKEIKAVIQHSKLPKIRSALRNIKGFQGMVVSEVEDSGENLAMYKLGILEDFVNYSPKVLITTVVPDHLAEGILHLLVEVGYSGRIGDGMVWVTPVERFVHLSEKITVLD